MDRTCETCGGRGSTGPVHINRGDAPHEWRESMPCRDCAGLPTGDWREGICAAPNCSCYEKHGMRIVPATYRAMIDRLIQDIAPEGKGE